MKGERRKEWIEAAYRHFSKHGDAGISIEAIARTLGKNKSSFYHYFGAIDVLRSDILSLHLDRSKAVGEKIASARQLDPDVLRIIVAHKTDFLFHKQLKLAPNKVYKAYYDKAYALVEAPLLEKISSGLNLENQKLFSGALLNLASDNFLLRIDEAILTEDWLRKYLQELRGLSRHIS